MRYIVYYVEGSTEHYDIGVVVGKTEDPKSYDVPPFRELAHRSIHHDKVISIACMQRYIDISRDFLEIVCVCGGGGEGWG